MGARRRISIVLLILTMLVTLFIGMENAFSEQEIEIYYIKTAENNTLVHFNAPSHITSLPVEVFDNQENLIRTIVLSDYYTSKTDRGTYNTFILRLANIQSYGKLITNPNTSMAKEYIIYNSPNFVYSNGIYINNNLSNSTKIYPYIEETIQNLNNEIIHQEIINKPGQQDNEEELKISNMVEEYALPKTRDQFMETPSSDAIKVMSFNINYGKDRNGFINLDKVAELIRDSGADIIGLQEVEKFSIRSNREDQLAYLAEKLSMYYAYGPNISNPLIGQYGNAILSKYPIKSSNNFHLPSGRERRGMITAVIDIGGRDVNFISTHLGLNYQERERQVASILNYLKTIEGEPLVLVGDLNALPDSREVVQLAKVLQDTGLLYENFYTYAHKSPEPNVRIDYIFISNSFKHYYSEVLPDKVSDHQPVVSVIALEQ